MKHTGGSFDNYRKSITVTPVLRQAWISCILEDTTDHLWIGSLEWVGLTSFNIKTKEFLHYLPGTSIQSIVKDNDETLWIGTNRGLYKFNPAKASFELFVNQDAGFMGNISVYHILEDHQHFLWLNTSMGISRISRNRSEIILIAKRNENIQSIYAATQAGCYKGKGGELFFSNNKENG